MSAVTLGDKAVVKQLNAVDVETAVVRTEVLSVTQDATLNARVTVAGLFECNEFISNGRVAMSDNQIFLDGIPTTDPAVFGRVWRNGTDLKVSIG